MTRDRLPAKPRRAALPWCLPIVERHRALPGSEALAAREPRRAGTDPGWCRETRFAAPETWLAPGRGEAAVDRFTPPDEVSAPGDAHGRGTRGVGRKRRPHGVVCPGNPVAGPGGSPPRGLWSERAWPGGRGLDRGGRAESPRHHAHQSVCLAAGRLRSRCGECWLLRPAVFRVSGGSSAAPIRKARV
jgi:hypothetical protein